MPDSYQHRSRRRAFASMVVALVAAVALLLALPLTSLGASISLTGAVGGLVNGVTKTLQTTVQHVLTPSRASTVARTSSPVPRPQASRSAAPASTPAAGTPTYTPPMYGTNPHGQGSVAAVGLGSSSNVPYTYAPGGSPGELVVVGRGRSEQNANGGYDSHTTIAALMGNELLGVNATEGQTNSGPLQALQTQLDAICSSTSEAICLTLLAADTNATSSGANTHFQAVGLTSKQILGLSADAASSDSFIQTSGTCQKAGGDSTVANVGITGVPTLVGAASSNESSSACSGQTPTQTANSSVVNLGGTGLPLPAAGCANGTPNTSFTPLGAILPIYCNADSTTQAALPSGVREALTVLGLQGTTSSLLKVTTAASESHAVAPSSSTPTKHPGSGSGSGKGNGSGKTTHPSGSGKCTDGDRDCGIGPNGERESCTDGADPDGDGDCAGACSDADHDCGIGPNGEREICVNGADPDGDGDCANGTFTNEVTATKASSSLPFTGENILEVVLAGLVLTGLGMGIRLRKDLRSGKSS